MRRRATNSKRNGFTIVEILVVLVVVAILAMITIVSYNRVQQRAANSQTANNAALYQKLLSTYKVNSGGYPTTATSVCLGTDYTADRCWLANVNESTAFMTQLESVAGKKLPSSNYGVFLKGMMFTPASLGNKLDGVNTDFLAYIITGNTTERCPYGPVATLSSGQLFTSARPTNDQTVAPNSSGDIQCWVALP